MLKELLANKPTIQKHLFECGFLITTDALSPEDDFPFYGNWIQTDIQGYTFLLHNRAKLHTFKHLGNTFFLIGHAYNPFSLEHEETAILSSLAASYKTDKFFDSIDELTGVFLLGIIHNSGIEFLLDASGMQYGCYGCINGNLYIVSHMRLVGELLHLQTPKYISQLTGYRWYRYMMGNYLPGDITCYREFKRIIPNTYISYSYSHNECSVFRFYPRKTLQTCTTEAEYRKVITEASNILRNTMELIPKKWPRPAISLTGGIDSNTTFAAANGIYHKYSYFSYVSMHRESVDSAAAKDICTHFALPHNEYLISESNEDFPDYDIYKLVLQYNGGNIGSLKDDDTRKKISLMQQSVCDVEVKSWVSETIRAYTYKYFGRKKFPKRLSPRHYTALYKIFFARRDLVWKTRRCFREYLNSTKLHDHMYNYDESDFFVWEMMHGGKCGLDIGVMKSCFDITIPYNNRKLLDLLLRVPLQSRISDQHHMDLKKALNQELFDLHIRVVNLNETTARKRAANLCYIVNSLLPF